MKFLTLQLFVACISLSAIAQTITTLSPTQTSTCAGGNIIVQYETTGTFDLMCTFTAQLSDEWGDFSNPIPIGSVPINTGVIFGTIPVNTEFGFGYRVRVISSNPYVIGTENPFPPIVITSSAISSEISTDPATEVCEGDTVELSVLPNESYFWSTGDTTQSILVTQSGNYTVTVTNYLTGCEVSSPPVSVTVHPLPPVDLGPDMQRCVGETVVLDAGSGYVQYSWNNGASAAQIVSITQSGTYFVGVRDSFGCINFDTTHIQFHPNPSFSLGNDTTLCSNNYLLSVPAGYEHYNWNNGLSFNPVLEVTQSGIYHVVVVNQFSCSGYDTVVVQILPVPTIELGNPVFACEPPVILNAGDNYSGYNWNSGDGTAQYYYVQLTGMQHVTITDPNGCQASDSVYVGIFGLPAVDLGQLITAEYNDTIELDAGTGMLHYVWNTGDTTQTITIFATDLTPGIYFYEVTVTGNYGCTNSDEVTVQILEPGAVHESFINQFRVFPNPFSDVIYTDSPSGISFLLTDITGRFVLQESFGPGSNSISTGKLPAGFYIVSINNTDGLTATYTFFKTDN